MCKIFYKWAIEAKAPTYYLELQNIVDTIDECDLWDEEPGEELISNYAFQIPPRFRVKRQMEDKVVYDIFDGFMHIHISLSEKERVYSIRLQDGETDWFCPFDITTGKVDYSHPTNNFIEVFVAYTVPVLDITEVSGHVYKHGSWNKYVYKTVNGLKKEMKSQTEEYKFNIYYNKK